MSKRIAYYLAVAAALLLIAYVWFGQQSDEVGVTPGKLAPHFSLPDLTQEEQALSDFRGKTVLLSIWTLT